MAAPSQSQAHLADAGGWLECRRQRRARTVESASASHRGAAAGLLTQAELRWRLCRKGKVFLKMAGWSAGGRDEHAPWSPPPPRGSGGSGLCLSGKCSTGSGPESCLPHPTSFTSRPWPWRVLAFATRHLQVFAGAMEPS